MSRNSSPFSGHPHATLSPLGELDARSLEESRRKGKYVARFHKLTGGRESEQVDALLQSLIGNEVVRAALDGSFSDCCRHPLPALPRQLSSPAGLFSA
jgi:hypothetical protein